MGIYVGSGGALHRGCDVRQAGGVYLNVATGPKGKQLSEFMLCPPAPLPPDLILPARGQVLSRLGHLDVVFDLVGGDYPNVLDILEEGNTVMPNGRLLGFSRHIAPEFGLRIPAGAWLVLAHRRAFIKNWAQYPHRENDACPHPGKHPVDLLCTDRDMPWFPELYPLIKDVGYPYQHCAGYWRDDIEGGVPVDGGRMVTRRIGDVTYTGMARPENLPYDYETGLIALLPIGSIQVIDGSPETETNYKRLSGYANLPVEIAPE